MLASLPMYDHPALRPATDRFWRAIRSALGDGPDTLTRTGSPWDHWTDPDLLLSQTCGYPYRALLYGHVQLVATPDYDLPGCATGQYNSVFVAQAGADRPELTDFAGARFAYNEAMSQSGWAAPMLHARAAGVAFGSFRQTGGHALSAQAVAAGDADLAALDAQSWRLMQAHDDFAQDLVEITRTAPTPALPFITAASQDPARIRAAMVLALDSLSPDDRAALSLTGFADIAPSAYLAVPSPPPPPKT